MSVYRIMLLLAAVSALWVMGCDEDGAPSPSDCADLQQELRVKNLECWADKCGDWDSFDSGYEYQADGCACARKGEFFYYEQDVDVDDWEAAVEAKCLSHPKNDVEWCLFLLLVDDLVTMDERKEVEAYCDCVAGEKGYWGLATDRDDYECFDDKEAFCYETSSNSWEYSACMCRTRTWSRASAQGLVYNVIDEDTWQCVERNACPLFKAGMEKHLAEGECVENDDWDAGFEFRDPDDLEHEGDAGLEGFDFDDMSDGGYECVDIVSEGCDDVKVCCSTDRCYYKADGKRFNCNGLDCTEAAEELMDFCSGGEESYQCTDIVIEGCDDAKICCDTDDCYYEADGRIKSCDGLDCTAAAEFITKICGGGENGYECTEITVEGCTFAEICCDSDDCYFRADGEIFPCDGLDCSAASSAMEENCSGGPATHVVGDACESNDDCAGEMDCLTSDYVNTAFGRDDLTVKNGYCSLALCTSYTVADGHSDAVCNASIGGLCFSLFTAMGESYAPMGLCFESCQTDADCRAEDDNFCLDPAVWKNGGLLDASVYNHYYGGVKVCVPRDLIDAMEDHLAEE